MARSWGHNAHRFSIEWSRIEPSQGRWNTEALEHYREVIRELRKRGLEPMVTRIISRPCSEDFSRVCRENQLFVPVHKAEEKSGVRE